MKAVRRQGTLYAAQVSDDLGASADNTAPPLVDPASVAVEILLAHILDSGPLADAPAAQDGVVTLLTVPSPEWVEPALETWKRVARSDRRCVSHHGDTYGATWLAVAAEKQLPRTEAAWAADAFASKVAKGWHCIGIAHDPAWLPPDLAFAADHRLTLPTLSDADVHVLAERLCGAGATVAVCDTRGPCLTPRLLRLARRPGQATDDYLRRLAGLVARERDTTASRVVETPRTAPTLDRLHGMDEAVQWGRDLARDLDAHARGTLAWSDVDGGCLLSGPPGCGKTLFARALATTCGVPLVVGSYGQWLGTGHAHQGDLLKAMRATFADARARAPCILFIDEVDSFPDRASVADHNADWNTQVVNALLAEIDGVEGRNGVVLVAACNHPERLDPALVRSGRLDRHVRIALPDRTALAAILREHLGTDADGWDLSRAALLASESSGADCERHVRGARRRARTQGRPIRLGDLMLELGGTVETEADNRLAAVHEAGHAVAAAILLPGSVTLVSLRAGMDRGGSVRTTTAPNYITADVLRRQIVVALSGRAAEEIILGAPSSGSGGPSGSDLAIATGLAATAAGALGFDADLGLAWRGLPGPGSLAGTMVLPGMAASVSRTLERAYDEALELVRGRRAAVEALAAELLAHTVLDGEAVTRVITREVVT